MFLMLLKRLNSIFSFSHLVVTCLAVRRIENVNIYPVRCMTTTTNFNDGCSYSCKPGFKFVSGDQKRVCSHDGTWTGTELVCKGKTFISYRNLRMEYYVKLGLELIFYTN